MLKVKKGSGRAAPLKNQRLRGLVGALRELPVSKGRKDDSFIVIPAEKRASVYASAKAAGVRVTVKVDGDSALIWRLE